MEIKEICIYEPKEFEKLITRNSAYRLNTIEDPTSFHNQDDYLNKVAMIRTQLQNGYYKTHIIKFEKFNTHWIKLIFFDWNGNCIRSHILHRKFRDKSGLEFGLKNIKHKTHIKISSY